GLGNGLLAEGRIAAGLRGDGCLVGQCPGGERRRFAVQAVQPALAPAVMAAGRVGALRCPVGLGRDHADAVDRAGRHAQIAAGAAVGNDGMHELVRAQDGVGGTGLYAQRTAYAVGVIDRRRHQGAVAAAALVQRQLGQIQQLWQWLYALRSAGRAAVDGLVILGDGLGIGTAAVITAFGALGLGQDRIDAVDER